MSSPADAGTGTGGVPDAPDIDDVHSEPQREQIRETMRTARRVRDRNVLGGFRNAFGSRDAGEALVGSFLFGIPMIVEDGTLDIGRHIAAAPLSSG